MRPQLTTLEEVKRQIGDLPSLPASAVEALRLMEDPQVSADRLQRVIGKDQSLAAQILKFSNSAMYCLQRQVSTLSHAIAILGLETLRSIVVAASIRTVFYSGRKMAHSLPLHLLWQHAWGAAVVAQTVARRARYRDTDEAFTCGLMHDLGKLVMLSKHAPAYIEIIRGVERGDARFYDLEQASFGYTHAQVGALLATKWSFPPQLVEAILHHHDLASAPEYSKLTCITDVANRMMAFMGIGFEKEPSIAWEEEPGFLSLGFTAVESREAAASAMDAISQLPEFKSALQH
jgi:putative nucleotidyltransferase with HDIG domain